MPVVKYAMKSGTLEINKFDQYNSIRFGEKHAILYSKKDKIVAILGSKYISKTISPLFNEPIAFMSGSRSEKNGIITYIEFMRTLKPGEKGYIETVLLDKVQNKLNMEVNL